MSEPIDPIVMTHRWLRDRGRMGVNVTEMFGALAREGVEFSIPCPNPDCTHGEVPCATPDLHPKGCTSPCPTCHGSARVAWRPSPQEDHA